jgi:cupin 2 domain-containing protein
MKSGNLFADIPEGLQEESFQDILNRRNVRIERIVSQGQRSPEGFWYDQHWDEWVLLLRGRAGLEIQGCPAIVELGPGDHLFIPAFTRHRVAWTDAGESSVWLAVHIHSQDNL